MRLGSRLLCGDAPVLVAIVNLSADSFSGDGQRDLAAVIDAAAAHVAAGADLLDVGAESTRPGAEAVAPDAEAAALHAAVAALVDRFDLPVAVDTRRAASAAVGLAAGAVMVNDTSGSADAAMAAVVGGAGAAWVLMHAPHDIGAMGWSQPVAAMPGGADDGVAVIARDLEAMVTRATEAGVARAQLAVDPGFGFGKSRPQNLALLRRQPALEAIGLPLYLGASRKSTLGHICATAPGDRLGASLAAAAAAVIAGARFVRVHDVAASRQAIDVAYAVRSGDDRPAAERGRPWRRETER